MYIFLCVFFFEGTPIANTLGIANLIVHPTNFNAPAVAGSKFAADTTPFGVERFGTPAPKTGQSNPFFEPCNTKRDTLVGGLASTASNTGFGGLRITAKSAPGMTLNFINFFRIFHNSSKNGKKQRFGRPF